MLVDEVRKYLGEGGHLSKAMPSYEYRQQQLSMSEAVAGALTDGCHLMVEAGTGTGKSQAYLIPAILWAMKNNKRVVISTYTKTLQQQILDHDIPLLREKFGLAFRYAVCLGHENYLSLRRLKRTSQTGMFVRPEEDRQLRAIFDWAGVTTTGVKSELPELSSTVWEEVGRQKDLCMGKNCETYNSCFYFKERRKWFSAHLLVVNHHLFFANVASSGAVLPRYDAVIFDEAQNIEEVATSFLGLEISNTGLLYFLDRLYNARTHKGLLSRIDYPAPLHLHGLVNQTRHAVEIFFTHVFEVYGRQDRVVRFYEPPMIDNLIYTPMQELFETLKSLESRLQSEEDKLEIAAAAARCFEYNITLQAILHQMKKDYVYWLEVSGKKRGPRAVLCGVPINVAAELDKQVFSKTERVVLTSATLTTNRKFDFIKERIGYNPKEEMMLDSPFDFAAQAMLYLAGDLPEPSDKTDGYIRAVADRAREIILATGGKTFVLFTSYDVMNRVYRELLSLPFPLLKQGDLPTHRMIERFKAQPSVIFGTNSFWQGVDIPGEALTSVIITKLPFDVPNEPLVEARLEDLRKKSLNPFRHYQIPRAIIQLKQGFGRLIRKKTDTGIVAILDSRMVHRSYGKQFIKSLPPCRITESLGEVKKFLAEITSASRCPD